MFPGLTPELYINNKKQLEDFQCANCFELSTNILKCSGSCRKYICLPCKSLIDRTRRGCTFCTQGKYKNWISTPVKGIQFEFTCPYNQQNHPIFTSVEHFVQHCYDCPQMNENHQTTIKRMQNFECQVGHRLVFLSEQAVRKLFPHRRVYTVFTNSQCCLCGKENSLCRSACYQCQKQGNQRIFCVKCRKVPATKTHCPVGHTLTRRTEQSISATCDFCGKSLSRFEGQGNIQFGYRDSNCNFDICYNCYKTLPEQNQIYLNEDYLTQTDKPKPSSLQE